MKLKDFMKLFNKRVASYGEYKDLITGVNDYRGFYNYISNEDFELYADEMDELLNIFYNLEDETDYKNKDISKIIDYLQEKEFKNET